MINFTIFTNKLISIGACYQKKKKISIGAQKKDVRGSTLGR